MTGVDEIRAQALEVAAGWSPPGAPASWQLTASVFRVIAGHDELLERLAGLPPDRLPALLASAAISFLARRERPDPLVRYFPEPDEPQSSFDAGFDRTPRAFVTARLDAIVGVCRGHHYQMNEVARCAQPDLRTARPATAATGQAAPHRSSRRDRAQPN
jgi:hypothetical protein